jgi:Zn-dependent peptidase ImmA (M78 family)/DNA-binding XRE family transcriptional regulator
MNATTTLPDIRVLFAERFKSARMLNGFSLQDLADKLDNKISRQALHKYEKGEVIPDSEMMAHLCTALGVKQDYFFRGSPIELGAIEFRKLKKLPAKEQHKIIEHTKDILYRYLELEEIIGIEANFVNPLSGNDCISSFSDVEKASVQVRKKWNLGADPIYNSIELLEDHQIKVVEVHSDDAFDGMQTWVNQHIPVIAINRSRVKSADRIRFTVLHELGHLLLPLQGLSENEKEKYCHQFAAAMLFPKDTAEKELGSTRKKLFVQELGALKQQYGISIQALVYRSRDLGIISDSFLKQFMFLMVNNHWKINEPIQYNGLEKSNRFKQLIFRALAEDLISISKAAVLSNLSLIDFRKQIMLVE